jgi:CBS domain-containing protein
MNSLVRDMMTTDVVTVEPSTPFKEIVARLTGRRRIQRREAAGRWRSGVARQVRRLAGQRGGRLASTLR